MNQEKRTEYHLVWTRDMCNGATGLLAAGNTEVPLRALIYLACTQKEDGGFYQNFWINGEPYWRGTQLDETAFPILLAWRLHRAKAFQNFDPYASADTTPTIQASATDEDGTYSAGNTVQVSVVSTPADVTPPTAALTAGNISSAGGSSYSFTVVFSDDQGVLASDLNDSDVMILGPNGFSQAGHLVSLDSNSNGTPRSATYSISAPGGSWNYTANGSYLRSRSLAFTA